MLQLVSVVLRLISIVLYWFICVVACFHCVSFDVLILLCCDLFPLCCGLFPLCYANFVVAYFHCVAACFLCVVLISLCYDLFPLCCDLFPLCLGNVVVLCTTGPQYLAHAVCITSFRVKKNNWQRVLLQLLGHAVSHIAFSGFPRHSTVKLAGHNRPGHCLLPMLPQEHRHLLPMLEHCPHKQVVKSAYKLRARGWLDILMHHRTLLQRQNSGCF